MFQTWISWANVYFSLHAQVSIQTKWNFARNMYKLATANGQKMRYRIKLRVTVKFVTTVHQYKHYIFGERVHNSEGSDRIQSPKGCVLKNKQGGVLDKGRRMIS